MKKTRGPAEVMFLHKAVYRFREVVTPAEPRPAEQVAEGILAAIGAACDRERWALAGWNVLPDRVEVLVLGEERPEMGAKGVAAALDAAVHGVRGPADALQ